MQYLDLSMAGAGPDVLEEIFSICKDLKKVSLENLELNDKICRYVALNVILMVVACCWAQRALDFIGGYYN